MVSDEQKREIYRALTTVHPDPDSVFELCAIGPKVPKSKAWEGHAGGKKAIIAGWYNDKVKATKAAAELDSIGAEGIYITVNPCQEPLLARANNRLIASVARTQDAEISRLNWLPIDIDPQRPAGISSSNHEHKLALEKAVWLKDLLTAEGWSDPVMADSGNGAHLLFRLPDLENTKENVELVKAVLNGLNGLYCVHTEGVTLAVDTTVFNPARLWKLYGTHARKGDNTTDRPHRLASILQPERREG